MLTATVVLLVVALAYATATDWRSRRIPNRLTFPMLFGGLLLQGLERGQAGMIASLAGMGVALAIMVVPFAFNWVGAGDVKLVMAVGALTGPDFAFNSLLYAAILAGVFALIEIVRMGQVGATARYILSSWYLPAPQGLALKGRLPYAPAIALGCAIAFFVAPNALS